MSRGPLMIYYSLFISTSLPWYRSPLYLLYYGSLAYPYSSSVVYTSDNINAVHTQEWHGFRLLSLRPANRRQTVVAFSLFLSVCLLFVFQPKISTSRTWTLWLFLESSTYNRLCPCNTSICIGYNAGLLTEMSVDYVILCREPHRQRPGTFDLRVIFLLYKSYQSWGPAKPNW